MDFPEYYFSTFNQKCEVCNNWITHGICSSNEEKISDEERHLSCCCFLLQFHSICCCRGFEHLIHQKPQLLKKITDIPRHDNLTQILYFSYKSPLLKDCSIYEQCKNVILKTLNKK